MNFANLFKCILVSKENKARSYKFCCKCSGQQLVFLHLFKYHTLQAEAIGRRGQDLMESLSMDRVYDYMYHLILGYSKLMDFKPIPPASAREICLESVLCFAGAKQREFLEESIAFPFQRAPCKLVIKQQ